MYFMFFTDPDVWTITVLITLGLLLFAMIGYKANERWYTPQELSYMKRYEESKKATSMAVEVTGKTKN